MNRTIGEVIREARKRRGLTQGELAAQMGVGRTQVVNIESGRFRPSVQSLEEAADALRVSLLYRSNRGWTEARR